METEQQKKEDSEEAETSEAEQEAVGEASDKKEKKLSPAEEFVKKETSIDNI